jgi:dolichol-phosphate mannosyltransferase
MPPSRRLANVVGRRAFSWAVGRDVPDNQSGYRLVGPRLMAAMLDSKESGFEFEIEMIVSCLRHGWPVEWVPIRTIYGTTSHIRPIHHLRHFVRATRSARRTMRGGQ